MRYSVFFTFAILKVASARPFWQRQQAAIETTLKWEAPLTVVATVTNTGAEDISLLKTGTILSDLPVEHFTLFNNNNNVSVEVPFEGIHAAFDIAGLGADAWQFIAAGNSTSVKINLGPTYSILEPGKYSVVADSLIQAIPGQFNSATVKELMNKQEILEVKAEMDFKITEDGVEMAGKFEPFSKTIVKRAQIVDCSGDREKIMRDAFNGAKALAEKAASLSATGNGQVFPRFFMTQDRNQRKKVSEVFKSIAKTATLAPSDPVPVSCSPAPGACAPGVVAFAVSLGTDKGPLLGQGKVFACDSFYGFPATSETCEGEGRPDIMIHELAHLYAKHDTVYGPAASKKLNLEQAFGNSDNFRYYARSVDRGCFN